MELLSVRLNVLLLQVSEGLDFVDKNGRAVVITGIPYAPAKDPKVLMKRSYLDQQTREASHKQVNQSVGQFKLEWIPSFRLWSCPLLVGPF